MRCSESSCPPSWPSGALEVDRDRPDQQITHTEDAAASLIGSGPRESGDVQPVATTDTEVFAHLAPHPRPFLTGSEKRRVGAGLVGAVVGQKQLNRDGMAGFALEGEAVFESLEPRVPSDIGRLSEVDREGVGVAVVVGTARRSTRCRKSRRPGGVVATHVQREDVVLDLTGQRRPRRSDHGVRQVGRDRDLTDDLRGTYLAPRCGRRVERDLHVGGVVVVGSQSGCQQQNREHHFISSFLR